MGIKLTPQQLTALPSLLGELRDEIELSSLALYDRVLQSWGMSLDTDPNNIELIKTFLIVARNLASESLEQIDSYMAKAGLEETGSVPVLTNVQIFNNTNPDGEEHE